MNYKPILVFLLSSIITFACQNTPTNNQSAAQNTSNTEGVQTPENAPAQVTPIPEKPVPNYTIVPFQQVGGITAAITEGELKTLFGDKNVVRENRGEVQTVVFKGSPNELQIAWKEGAKFRKIESVIIMGKGAKWRSPEGIGIGSTLKELELANGKAVTLAPVGDDDEIFFRPLWNGGKVHPKFVVSFDKTTDRVFAMQINF